MHLSPHVICKNVGHLIDKFSLRLTQLFIFHILPVNQKHRDPFILYMVLYVYHEIRLSTVKHDHLFEKLVDLFLETAFFLLKDETEQARVRPLLDEHLILLNQLLKP